MYLAPLTYFNFCFQDFIKLNKRIVILEEKEKERMNSTPVYVTKSEKVTYVGNEKVRLRMNLN